ncbi:hypothetical protein C8J57DRAFT_604360 [Mycena rebaudengoi]|nr:hypothetical protein C8J57DRAFT_604360 [Mycena rebaudengoi]
MGFTAEGAAPAAVSRMREDGAAAAAPLLFAADGVGRGRVRRMIEGLGRALDSGAPALFPFDGAAAADCEPRVMMGLLAGVTAGPPVMVVTMLAPSAMRLERMEAATSPLAVVVVGGRVTVPEAGMVSEMVVVLRGGGAGSEGRAPTVTVTVTVASPPESSPFLEVSPPLEGSSPPLEDLSPPLEGSSPFLDDSPPFLEGSAPSSLSSSLSQVSSGSDLPSSDESSPVSPSQVSSSSSSSLSSLSHVSSSSGSDLGAGSDLDDGSDLDTGSDLDVSAAAITEVAPVDLIRESAFLSLVHVTF